MAEYKCFLVEPTDQFVYVLRRYLWREVEKCPLPRGYHDKSVVIGQGPRVHTPEDCWGWGGVNEAQWAAHSDPRWPTRCDCGYEFKDTDGWQPNEDVLFKGAPDGQLYRLHELPVGAMWYATWMKDWLGPDGKHLVVKCPSGDWSPDGPAKDSTFPWRRTGVPPDVTVTPSIDFGPGKFHGWLTGGILRDC